MTWMLMDERGNAIASYEDEVAAHACMRSIVQEEPEARADVSVGDLGYWPPGNAFCIFFGRTPASSGSAPRAASPVTVVGRIVGDATTFRRVRSGTGATTSFLTTSRPSPCTCCRTA